MQYKVICQKQQFDYKFKKMASNIGEKRPISPKQLFQKLLESDYKELECIDQSAHIKQQRQILLSLISEYRLEISRRMQEFQKLQKLVLVRNSLRVQLEQLRDERIGIDRNIEYEIGRHKVNPNELQEHSQFKVEIQELRHKNSNLELRLRELNQYCVKIQRQNVLLEKEIVAVQEQDIRVRSRSDIGGDLDCGNCGNWRQKVRIRRMQEEKLNIGLQNRIREMEEENRRYIMNKQAQIAEGNRRRMASFQQKLRKI